MSDYRVYDARGARARSHAVAPRRRERRRPSREAVMERGRRIKRASRRAALLCFAAFAVLAGLRAGPSGAASPSASVQLRHHRVRRHHRIRRHLHTRRHSTARAPSGSSSAASTPAPPTTSNLAPQQTSQTPVVQSSGS
jgi:hypothetical protein